MLMSCFRCSKEIDTPSNSNADYIIAEDTIVREPREVFIAIKHNTVTRNKETLIEAVDKEGERSHPEVMIEEADYSRVEVPRAVYDSDTIRIVVEMKERDIQKTGIICPDDYKPTDFVIWGIHKKATAEIDELRA